MEPQLEEVTQIMFVLTPTSWSKFQKDCQMPALLLFYAQVYHVIAFGIAFVDLFVFVGITTYSPFKRWNIKAGDRVGVLGIGGLGHLGILWGKALGAYVIALSSTDKKVKCK